MRRLACGSAVLLVAALALPHRVSAQDVVPRGGPGAQLLSLPFVPQSEALCGGAALAMVLRYHGVGGVQAEDFAHLVVPSGIGIRTTDLADAARARGLEATPFTAQRAVVRALLARAEPVIALIEDRPGVYHYVVLLAWGDGRVLFHDPAVGPHQVMDEDELLRAWAPAGYWALRTTRDAAGARTPQMADVALDTVRAAPDIARAARADSAGSHPADARCDELLTTAAAAAARDDLGAAERALDAAAATCTEASLVARERAGLRFRQGRYDEAALLAQQRIAVAPTDAHAWELLGASRFVRGERDAALVAWNRVGRPVNDLTQIDGLRRTPYRVAARAVAIEPGTVVTPAALALARRRLTALPSIARARVDYEPFRTDSVRVAAAVLERPLLPLSALELAVHGARAALEERVLVQPANLLRLGESWRVDATWQQNRRAFALGVDLPGVLGLHALTSVDAGVHDHAFAPADAAVLPADSLLLRESVRGVALGLADWASGALRWRAQVGLERWTPHGTLGRALAGAAVHLGDERVVLDTDVTGWWGDAGALARLRVDATAHTPLGTSADALLLLHGQLTHEDAPRARWAGAGNGRVGGALLRAHPLLENGVVRGPFWAPRLVAGTLELRRWLAAVGPARLGAAVFLDGAVAAGASALRDRATASAADAGAGLRVTLPAGPTIRLDAAWSLRTGAPALSAGWSVR